MSFYYLATPYSKYPYGMEVAFQEAARAGAWLLKQGLIAFVPIAHSHPLAVHGGLDLADHDIWLPADRPFMEAARGLIVAKMLSWEKSVGVQHEIDYFRSAGKPIYYLWWPDGAFDGPDPRKEGESD